jgi:hypothetical protein
MSSNSRLARDTQALRWSVLTQEERKIIQQVNDLIREVKARNEGKAIKRKTLSPWAVPEMDRFNGVIMLDGRRGSGKTSLLLTMITGWQHDSALSGEGADATDVKTVFREMNNTVRCLKPLDFDPLPPDLPLYNWIIQAFEPLVSKASGHERGGDEWKHDEPQLSLRDRFQKLQNTAALGWTTGLLREALATDVGDFIVWHSEQQSRWQDLSRDWFEFLDSLFERLEKVDGEHGIPHGAIIALPIDDLDLQTNRVRELLSALRVLRHGRLVYVLTGHSDNLKVCLQTEFYRNYLMGEPSLTEDLKDKVKEQSESLAGSLIQKVVPDPHRFELKGLRLSEIREWSPTRGEKLGAILERHWGGAEFSDFIDHLGKRDRGKTLNFRSLLCVTNLIDVKFAIPEQLR